jgi:hypothetical protein
MDIRPAASAAAPVKRQSVKDVSGLLTLRAEKKIILSGSLKRPDMP